MLFRPLPFNLYILIGQKSIYQSFKFFYLLLLLLVFIAQFLYGIYQRNYKLGV